MMCDVFYVKLSYSVSVVCHISSRWHKVSQYLQIYTCNTTMHVLHQINVSFFGYFCSKMIVFSSKTSTNRINLCVILWNCYKYYISITQKYSCGVLLYEMSNFRTKMITWQNVQNRISFVLFKLCNLKFYLMFSS